jgi:hypothetical protein
MKRDQCLFPVIPVAQRLLQKTIVHGNRNVCTLAWKACPALESGHMVLSVPMLAPLRCFFPLPSGFVAGGEVHLTLPQA